MRQYRLVERLRNRLNANRFIDDPRDAAEHLEWHLDGSTDQDILDLLDLDDESLWLSGRDGINEAGFKAHIAERERLGKEI